MKALRVEARQLQLAEIPIPDAPSEALVRVTMSGICNTDIEIVRGYAGFAGTIGHEFVGVVERSEDRPDLVGQRVVGEINAGCGSCKSCISGDSRHCPTRTVLGILGRDGAHAEYLTLPSGNLIAVPDGVPDEQAVFTEPLAAALGITEQLAVSKGDHVAVIGDGKLGLLCALSLSLHTANVTLVGRHADKLKIAENAGIECCLAENLQQSGHDRDVVVEASGSESGFALALDMVRPRGKIILKSTFHGKPTWDASRVVVDEITVIGSRCGRFGPALRLLAEGTVDPTPLISETFRLNDGVKAMERASKKGVLKVLLRP